MDTPPNSAVMKASNDIDSSTGRRIKGPPTAGMEDPERTSHESRAGMEKDGSACRPQDQLAERNEGSATTYPHNISLKFKSTFLKVALVQPDLSK